FEHPLGWEEIRASMAQPPVQDKVFPMVDLEQKILQGWQGQLAGAAFGSPLEGYLGGQIRKVYGVVDHYLTSPETLNDDVVYEIVFLEACEKYGVDLNSRCLALEWLRWIPYAYSAEEVALKNLQQGIFPPQSGSWRNPYSDWIGAQMRGMICGMIAPGKPLEAARLAHLDAVISHSANGVYGEMFAAVLTSLAFIERDLPSLIEQAMAYLPQKSEYCAVVGEILEVLKSTSDSAAAWKALDRRFETYHWIHAYPNIAAVLFSLWYGEAQMSRSFSLLADAGLDVDCNGGLVGTILGIQGRLSEEWVAPLGDVVETYLRNREALSIRSLAQRTAKVAQELRKL
ncbi:MAG: ADP-ribosylglycohydrolase family protein, partial [Anaerolineales bacterium]|nr:ADP-ribosylglycohydrolase family protein [Anaerolineales bacterium]MDW8447717.1 ADP-ribosylglycohydrolase family protein [Anaerolineales bacterium]